MINIDSLNSIKACETPYEFEYKFGNGKGTGVFLSVLGDESEAVAVEQNALMAGERVRMAADPSYEIDPAKLGQKMAAIRLIGWRGIEEKYTPENALKLCMSNRTLCDQVVQASKQLGNFIKL
jgi:hypothetical protein